MKNEEKEMRLLKQLKDHKPIEIYLENDYYDTFYYQYDKYQGQFGYITLENLVEVVKGKYSHLRIEANE